MAWTVASGMTQKADVDTSYETDEEKEGQGMPDPGLWKINLWYPLPGLFHETT
jgi:hypothetical protein